MQYIRGETLSKSIFPVTAFKACRFRSVSSIFVSTLAALLSLREVIAKRSLVRRARAWIKGHHRYSAFSRDGKLAGMSMGHSCSKYEAL